MYKVLQHVAIQPDRKKGDVNPVSRDAKRETVFDNGHSCRLEAWFIMDTRVGEGKMHTL